MGASAGLRSFSCQLPESHAEQWLIRDSLDVAQYTSDADIVYLAQLAGVPVVELKDVSFSEHKVNGKSKG